MKFVEFENKNGKLVLVNLSNIVFVSDNVIYMLDGSEIHCKFKYNNIKYTLHQEGAYL